MRKISKPLIFVMCFGTVFSQISCIGFLAGIVLLLRVVNGHSSELPAAVALIIIGPSLLFVSIKIANNKLEILKNGKLALGSFKEWRNSFITRNNQVLVYLIYTYFDDRRKRREAYALSGTTDAHEKTHIFYKDEQSVILEYLPGSPEFIEENYFQINITPTIIKYIIIFTFACIFAIGSISL